MSHQERAIQTAKYSVMAVGLVMIFAIIKIPVKYTTATDPTVGYAITAVALIDLTIGLLGRPFFVRMASRNRQFAKPTPVQRWMIANICSLICIDSCLLLGFVLLYPASARCARRVVVWSGVDFLAFLEPWNPARRRKWGAFHWLMVWTRKSAS